MLGPDWLVEVTDLVSDFMRVGDPRVARMVDSSTLAGLEPGTTPFKVGTTAVPGALFTCGGRTKAGFSGPQPLGATLAGLQNTLSFPPALLPKMPPPKVKVL